MTMRPPQHAARDVDTRGFSYGMEPLRRQAQWLVDSLTQQLTHAKSQLTKAEAALTDTGAQIRRFSDEGAFGARASVDPNAYRRMLAYLAHLQQLHSQQCRARDDARKTCTELQATCNAAQLRLEAIESHRDESRALFAQEARRKQASETDRDWLARVAHAGYADVAIHNSTEGDRHD